MSLVDIAKELDKPEGTVRRWKSTQKWDGEQKSERSEKKASVRNDSRTAKEKAVAEEVEQVMNNPDLNDKQRLFCLHYIRCFNATKAYQKAYECDYNTAASIGYRLLENDGVREEINRLKRNRMNREMLDESDIFQKYMDIAYSDITDYLTFGTVKMEDEESGKEFMVNTVRFKESKDVDGTLISEVKQGRDGASIKLLDKQKALDWIASHMDLATDEQKARIEQMRANADRIKRSSSGDVGEDGVEIVNDAPTGEDIGDCNSKVSSDIQQQDI